MDKATRNVHPLAIPVRFAPCTGKRSADGIDVQSQDAFSTGGVRRFASHEIWTTEDAIPRKRGRVLSTGLRPVQRDFGITHRPVPQTEPSGLLILRLHPPAACAATPGGGVYIQRGEGYRLLKPPSPPEISPPGGSSR